MTDTKTTSKINDTRSAWKAPQLKSFVPVRETQSGVFVNPPIPENAAYSAS